MRAASNGWYPKHFTFATSRWAAKHHSYRQHGASRSREEQSRTVEVLTLRRLLTYYYILFFIHLESRRVDIAGCQGESKLLKFSVIYATELLFRLPVWSKKSSEAPPRSRRLLMVITQEPAQSLATLNGRIATNIQVPWEQQDVALSLVIPLSVKMFDVFAQGPPQRALTE